ncbi:MAG: thioredoxin family protein [Candidatus Oleimicrobiaceae bacterium]
MRGELKSWRIAAAVAWVAIALGAYSCASKEKPVGGGIPWLGDLTQGLAEAKTHDKPLMVSFGATWCPWCEAMEDSTFRDPQVIQKAGQFVAVRIDVDKQGDVANKYNANARKYNGVGIPNVLFMTAQEQRLLHAIGYRAPRAFLAVMDSALALYRQ